MDYFDEMRARREMDQYRAEQALREKELEGAPDEELMRLRRRAGKPLGDGGSNGRYIRCPCGCKTWHPKWGAIIYCTRCGCLM